MIAKFFEQFISEFMNDNKNSKTKLNRKKREGETREKLKRTRSKKTKMTSLTLFIAIKQQTSLFLDTQKPTRHNAFRPRGTSVRACEYRDLGSQRVFFCLGWQRAGERERAAFFFFFFVVAATPSISPATSTSFFKLVFLSLSLTSLCFVSLLFYKRNLHRTRSSPRSPR